MMATAGELRQIEFKRQFKQNQQEIFQDKNFQELRAFALEYVKQIVSRAAELSQEQQQEKPASQINKIGQPASLGLVASKINQEFRIPDTFSELEGAGGGQTNPSWKVEQSQPRLVCELPDLANASQTTAIGRENLLRRIEDEGEYKIKRPPAAAADADQASQRRKLYQRLNWHLFVSCFANCLPHTFVQTGSGRPDAAGVARGPKGTPV